MQFSNKKSYSLCISQLTEIAAVFIFPILTDKNVHANIIIKTSIKRSVRMKISQEEDVFKLLEKLVTVLKQMKNSGRCSDYMKLSQAYITFAPSTRWVNHIIIIDFFSKLKSISSTVLKKSLKKTF